MRSSHRLAFLFLLPSLIFVGLFAFYPIFESFRLSFYRSILTLPWLGQKMVGWQNYTDLWTDPVAAQSLRTTLFFVVTTIPLELGIGLGMALVMNEVFRGRGLLRAVVLIPWAIPTVVSSQMWRFIFNDRYGLFNFVLFGGDASRYLAPLADPILAPLTIIVAEVWKTAPFVALIVLAGLQTIPDELYEAASIDGATAWQQFRHVTLPLIRPALLLALLFRTIDALRVFDLVFVMTQGGPADATNVLSFLRLQKNLRGRHGRLRLRHRRGGFSSLLDPLPRLSADSQVQPFGRDAAMKRAAMLAIFSVGIGIYCLIPYLWFALTSWKSPAELTAIPPQLIPSFHWDFYRSALEERGLLRYIANSIIVAGTATGITIAIGSVAAYALARFQLPWTNAYLLLLLAISMFPQIAIAGPVWNLLNHLDWLNTYRGAGGGLHRAFVAPGDLDSHDFFS